MGHIKEPLDVDFFVDPKPITKADRERISEYIKADKDKRKKQKASMRKAPIQNK